MNTYLKTPSMVALILTLFHFVGVQTAEAKVLHWAAGCKTLNLTLENKSAESLTFWLQKFNPTLLSEKELSVPAQVTTTFKIQMQKSTDRFSLMHFNSATMFNASAVCSTPTSTVPQSISDLDGGVLTFRKTDLSTQTFHVQNLTTSSNTILVEILNRRLQKIDERKIMLRSNEFKNVAWALSSLPTDLQYFRVSGSSKFAAYSLSTTGYSGPMILQPQATSIDLQARYFEVGLRRSSNISLQDQDRYIVKITDPTLIEKAREQIANPQIEKILFAQIQKGHQGFNRNLSSNVKSLWSWSITQVTSFSDLGSTACNGAPQFVEDRIDSWIKNGARICFWNYRILREINAEEVASGQMPQ